MRLKNKITISGDTLNIHENVSYERKLELQNIAQEIWAELGEKFSGGSYDNDTEEEAITSKGITNPEERREVFLSLNKLADFEMNEGSFNPMKKEKKDLNLTRIADKDTKGFSLYAVSDNPNLIFAEKNGILYNTDEMGKPTTSVRMSLFNVNGLINEAKKAKTDPKDKKKADKTNYGHKDIADIDMVNPYELKKGIRIEMVDTEDYIKAMDKAVKKLKKDPMFYSNLIANAKETKGKRADVPTEVKDKKLNKISDKLKDKANEMEVSKKDVTKKNANDSLNKKEKASGKPKGVKEMTMTPKKAKGMKSMDIPGKEKKINLKESISIFNSLKKLLLS